MEPLAWNDLWPPDANALFVPQLVTAAVTVFVLGEWFGRLAAGGTPAVSPARAVAAKLVGGSWMAVATLGIVGWLGVPLADTAIVPGSVGLSLGLAVAIGLAITPVLVCAGWLPEMRQFYPEMRLAAGTVTAADAWRWRLAMIGSWLVYLVGYEALFRGLLLPLLARELTLWPGIAVTTGLYVLAHLARPSAESLASIPAGFVLAAITLLTGSILAAVVLHWIIASVNETASSMRAGPDRGPLH
jgi:membrane protease YdiL (CAAX protease family)